MEIDLEEGDVSLETEDRVTALVANLPIRRGRTKPLATEERAQPQQRKEARKPKRENRLWTATQA